MRNLCSVIFFGLFSIAFAAPAELQQAHMIEALTRAEPAVSSVIGLAAMKFPQEKKGAASRKEVIDLFDKMYQHYEPKFRATPRPYLTDTKAIEERNSDSKTRTQLKRLVSWGFVSPVGPLVTNNSDTLTNAEFGDALGYFITQALYLAHQPDPKWTPDLGGGG